MDLSFSDLLSGVSCSSKARSRRWCFVENNPIIPLVFESPLLKFLFYSKELGASGTPHFQGYLVSTNAVSLARLKKWNARAHFLIARGSEDQNIAYCSKSPVEGPFEFGVRSEQGKRTDLQTLCDSLIKDKPTKIDLVSNFGPSFIKYYKGINEVKNIINSTSSYKFEKLYVQFIFGPTGVGKTFRVYEICKEYINTGDFYKVLSSKGKWWDGYDSQNIILFDEFYGQVAISKMNSYLDGYPLQLEIKGSTTYKKWKIVFITSNDHPESFYKNSPMISDACRAGFLRRLDSIVNINESKEIVYLKGSEEDLKNAFLKLKQIDEEEILLCEENNEDDCETQPVSPVPELISLKTDEVLDTREITATQIEFDDPGITQEELDSVISTEAQWNTFNELSRLTPPRARNRKKSENKVTDHFPVSKVIKKVASKKNKNNK